MTSQERTKSGAQPSERPVGEDAPAQRLIHEYFLMIRESHLDTFGHVNNATYLQLFEEARWEWITERGYGLDVIVEKGLGPVILDATIKFRREIKNRQRVVIRSETLEYSSKIGKVRQALYRCEDEVLACEAIFSIALWDTTARKLVSPTPQWRDALLLDQSSE